MIFVLRWAVIGKHELYYMLMDYILAQLSKAQEEDKELREKLKKLCDEETEENRKIENLLENQDVGLELFSPRNVDSKVTEKIIELREQLNQNQTAQKSLVEQLSKSAEQIANWKKLLDEARESTVQSQTANETFEERKADLSQNRLKSDSESISKPVGKEELEHFLRDLDKALSSVYSDSAACEKQLKDTRYYLMALLSRQ